MRTPKCVLDDCSIVIRIRVQHCRSVQLDSMIHCYTAAPNLPPFMVLAREWFSAPQSDWYKPHDRYFRVRHLHLILSSTGVKLADIPEEALYILLMLLWLCLRPGGSKFALVGPMFLDILSSTLVPYMYMAYQQTIECCKQCNIGYEHFAVL